MPAAGARSVLPVELHDVDEQPAPTLAYADRITQHGVLVEACEGGGVRITVPSRGLGASLLNVVFNTPLGIWLNSVGVVGPRAVLEVTHGRLTITENDGDGNHHYRRTWPAAELTECRPNRFQRSLYLRVPGKEVWDALSDLDEHVIRFVAETLRPYLPNVS
jgi:hypothetical protein